MIRSAVLSLCLLVIASVLPGKTIDKHSLDVPRKVSTETDADAWRQLGNFTNVRRAPAALDTTFLLNHDFEGAGGSCDAMGWTPKDLFVPWGVRTGSAQLDNYWHVDDFSGLTGVNGGLVPLEGNQSMWCGARPDAADPVRCAYKNLPGYANHWNQWLRTDQCLTVTGDVNLSFQIFWDSEPTYDFTFIQWDECDDNWQDLLGTGYYAGLSGLGQWDTTLTVPDSLHSGNVRFRFQFASDGAWSDGDGGGDTDGGCTIDMLQVSDGNGVVMPLEDFEDEAVGDHNGNDWTSELAEGYGELAALFPGYVLLQEDPCVSDLSCIWGFLSGSTADYGCATPVPHPEQVAVPYENARGQYVDQQIWSPWIKLSGDGAVLELAYDVYMDLDIPDFMFSDFHVRGIDTTAVNPCPSNWFGDGFVEFGDEKTWLRRVLLRSAFDLVPLIPAGSTHIQISLDVIDYCQFGFPCATSCHSHSPLYDNVVVYRVGAEGPQWAIQDIHQFQDNFPDDGTITGTARADMAMDLNWPEPDQNVVPGDSAAVRVSDPVAGLAVEGNGKAAVFCYVSIDGPHSATAAASLICDSRYAYIADESWNGRTWHKFQADSCYDVSGDIVPDSYNFDFCDNLFVPGDTIWFFWGARNTNGDYSYASMALSTPGNQTVDGDEVATNADEFQILPAVGRDVADGGLGGDILYVDGMNFRGAQPYFDDSFQALGLFKEIDRYDIRGPSSAVSNHLGNRVKSTADQLVPIYKMILWNTGDLDVAWADGTGDNTDKSDDTGLALDFMDNINYAGGGFYLDGDNVATEWLQMTAASAWSLKNVYMGFYVTASDHQPVVGYNPWGIGVLPDFSLGGNPDSLVIQGGCPSPHAFDVLEAVGARTRVAMNYHNWVPGDSAFAPAVLSQRTENTVGDSVGFLLSGFSFHNIRDLEPAGYPVRYDFMKRIINYLDHIADQPVGSDVTALSKNALDQNIPNPFNPTTTIRYEVKETGSVSLKIYNVAGQLVKTLVDGNRVAGPVHEVTWNGLNNRGQPVSSGVYFYKLVARGFTQTKKMVLLK